MRRGQTVTVQKRDSNSWTVTIQKRDSNSWTVTVQVFFMTDFDYLRGITGFCLIVEFVASSLSFATTLISLQSEL